MARHGMGEAQPRLPHGRPAVSSNPRYRNYAQRVAIRKRWKAIGAPCALCGKPIDYSLPAGDPMSYEVDEIVPVSLGGDPCDFENTQPAHRRCNQKKGNGLGKPRKRLPLPVSRRW